MNGRCFVDTNILVYAQDRSAGTKFEVARSLVNRLWDTKQGVISTQVLQEFCITMQRKVARPAKFSDVRAALEDYLGWIIVINTQTTILDALLLQGRFQISFWDALILCAAELAEAGVVYSEDLSHRQRYGAVQVINPFLQ